MSSLGTACGRNDDGAGGDTDASTNPSTRSTTTPTPMTTTTPTPTPDEGTGVIVAPTPQPPPPTNAPTFAKVTSQVVGTAVGGNSGGEGEGATNQFSETVRNPDGTCTGFKGPGGQWTLGLESGAPVVFLAADSDEQIGTGQLGTSSWSDVDPGNSEQWNCMFPFSGEVEGTPDRFRIRVADLEPWSVRVDPTAPGTFVASVNTVARFDLFEACTEPGSFPEVSGWSVVGQFWSNGIPTLCGTGLSVVDIERPCRPEGFASDYIVSVTSADDPSVVFEGPDGLLVDPAELAPLTPVVVYVTTGRPC